jgi:aspartyl aminopeptidase
LTALFDVADIPDKTVICLLADKEEIGSAGNTGLRSRFFENCIAELCAKTEATPYNDLMLRKALRATKCISADVGAAVDPTYAEVSERKNAAFLNHGVFLMKYTGSGGKSGSSDANAEFVAEVRAAFEKENVAWQTGELGKVDIGGGGTVAQYLAALDIDVIDCGTPILSMHAPFEVSSKADLYMTYRAYSAFYKA